MKNKVFTSRAWSFTRIAFPSLLLIVAALALGGCWRSASYRYKLTLSLNTPNGIKTAFNVVEVTFSEISFPVQGEPNSTRGEALYIDLGPGRRPLIALLTYIRNETLRRDDFSWGQSEPTTVLEILCHLGTAFSSRITAVEQFGSCAGPYELPPKLLPDLVTFADTNDPKSVVHVDPNNLAETLGPDISWRSLTLQTTDEAVTTGIERYLPWLSRMPVSTGLDGRDVYSLRNAPLASVLHRQDFTAFP